jgi:hypothetical protein
MPTLPPPLPPMPPPSPPLSPSLPLRCCRIFFSPALDPPIRSAAALTECRQIAVWPPWPCRRWAELWRRRLCVPPHRTLPVASLSAGARRRITIAHGWCVARCNVVMRARRSCPMYSQALLTIPPPSVRAFATLRRVPRSSPARFSMLCDHTGCPIMSTPLRVIRHVSNVISPPLHVIGMPWAHATCLLMPSPLLRVSRRDVCHCHTPPSFISPPLCVIGMPCALMPRALLYLRRSYV